MKDGIENWGRLRALYYTSRVAATRHYPDVAHDTRTQRELRNNFTMPHSNRATKEKSLFAMALAWALVAVAVLNGASVFLKRTGVVEHDLYRRFWAVHCVSDAVNPARSLERQCKTNTTPREIEATPQWHVDADDHWDYVYRISGWELWLKAAKDVFVLIFVGVSFWFSVRASGQFAGSLRQAWPITMLSGYCAFMFGVSLVVAGPAVAMAGARPISFLMVALTAGWAAGRLDRFAVAIGILLMAQFLMAPFELLWGVHLFREWPVLDLAGRAVGSFSKPNSLGVFAVCGLAFYYCFSQRRLLIPLVAVTCLVVLASGSATGFICLTLAGLVAVFLRLPVNRRWPCVLVGAVVLGVVIFMLPEITGRPDLVDSVWSEGGRVGGFRAALLDRELLAVFFGEGLGSNSNFARNLAADGALNGFGRSAVLPADSTPTALVTQVGAVGLVLFYGTLAWAMLRDPGARAFYVTVAICSLTMSVIELFPVNILLGLALARSAGAGDPLNGKAR